MPIDKITKLNTDFRVKQITESQNCGGWKGPQ